MVGAAAPAGAVAGSSSGFTGVSGRAAARVGFAAGFWPSRGMRASFGAGLGGDANGGNPKPSAQPGLLDVGATAAGLPCRDGGVRASLGSGALGSFDRYPASAAALSRLLV